MEVLSGAPRLLILSSLLFVGAFCGNDNQELNDIAPITANNKVVNECQVGEACVRFCCDKTSLCSNLEFFNTSAIAAFENLDDDFKILKGIPECHETSGAFEQNTSWTFLKVGKIFF